MTQAFLVQVAGLIGAALVLLAYALLRLRRVSPESPAFHALNVVGAVILCAVAAEGRSAGFFVLNAAWTLIGLSGLAASVKWDTHREGAKAG